MFRNSVYSACCVAVLLCGVGMVDCAFGMKGGGMTQGVTQEIRDEICTLAKLSRDEDTRKLVQLLCRDDVTSDDAVYASVCVDRAHDSEDSASEEKRTMFSDIMNHKGYSNASTYKENYFLKAYESGKYRPISMEIIDELADL